MTTPCFIGQVIQTHIGTGPSRHSKPGLDGLSAWAKDGIATQSQSEARPTKRIKREHVPDSASTPATGDVSSRLLDLAQFQIVLRSEAIPAEFAGFHRLSTPHEKRPEDLEVTISAVEGIRRSDLSFKLSLVEQKNTAPITIEVDCGTPVDADVPLQLAAKLQRRSTGGQLGPASAGLLLSFIYDVRGDLSAALLVCTFSWRDGSGSLLGKPGIDAEVLAMFFNVPRLSLKSREGQDICMPQNFYDAVHEAPRIRPLSKLAQSAALATQLYPFQQRAVDWMLNREGVELDDSASLDSGNRTWLRKGTSVDGVDFFIDDLEGRLGTEDVMRQHNLKGGILSEEMGLGKTVELLSLICLHRWQSDSTRDLAAIPTTKATLIVAPNTILQQWKDETLRHAPQLKWTHYEGMTKLGKSKRSEEDAVAAFLDVDVVFTTYSVLAQEIHFAVEPPQRALRNATEQRPRKRSPLSQLRWWRICLDEAQMVESGVSNAATTASILARHNAWAVTGTPVKKDVEDLRGLLVFLHHQPFSNSPEVWKRMIRFYGTHFKDHFDSLFRNIAIRHTKDRIKDELRLPPQRRVVLTIPFTAVEEQNYKTLFEEMAVDCGLEPDGSPASGLWDPNDTRTIEKMREWLVRLRQTCLHPQVGVRNKRALGKNNGALRTVAEVLEVMIEQNEVAIRGEARMSITALTKKGHVIANAKNTTDRAARALPYYEAAVEKTRKLVTEARADLKQAGGTGIDDQSSEDERDDGEETPKNSKRGKLRNHLRNMLELQHACEFFVGTAFFQMKSNAEVKEDSEEWKQWEREETSHYDSAKSLRKEVLLNVTHQVERTMAETKTNILKPIDDKMPSTLDMAFEGGIESRRLLEKADDLSRLVEAQTLLLAEWRAKLTSLLTQRLVDKDDDEVTGEEYEESTKQQEDMYTYFDAYRALVADRLTAITGQVNTLVNHEMDFAYKQSLNWDHQDRLEEREPPESRQRMREVFDQRLALKQHDTRLLSFRGLIHEARTTESNLEWLDGRNVRAQREAQLVSRLSKHLARTTERYNDVQTQLTRDQELFRTLMNQRLEFYRQLQQLSDAVKPYKEELDETLDFAALSSFETSHARHEDNLASLSAKRRFLLHLRDESNDEGQRMCVICQSDFVNGVLTVCGHQFCKECIGHWWRQHHTCPVCKRRLRTADFYNITYKPQGLSVAEEDHHAMASTTSGSASASSANSPGSADGMVKIYNSMSAADLIAIQSIDLPSSRSFGTKIDTIARHLLHMRATDPGSKTIIFSQYRDFLGVLSSALSTFSISHVAIGGADSITRFREDASIEAFLLDAKSDSSGLNLVNATNVMLAEPLVNASVELQAIARVHRIGQTRETRVFMYLVKDTVEESVYEVSVRRRLELMMMRPKRDAAAAAAGPDRTVATTRSSTPASRDDAMDVDRAERLQVQAGGLERLVAKGKVGGENVRAEDLWKCLFGVASRDAAVAKGQVDVAARRGPKGGGLGAVVGSSAVTAGLGGATSAVHAEVDKFVRAEAASARLAASAAATTPAADIE